MPAAVSVNPGVKRSGHIRNSTAGAPGGWVRMVVPVTSARAGQEAPSSTMPCSAPRTRSDRGSPRPRAPASIRTGGACPLQRMLPVWKTWRSMMATRHAPRGEASSVPGRSSSAGTSPCGVATSVCSARPLPSHRAPRRPAADIGTRGVGWAVGWLTGAPCRLPPGMVAGPAPEARV
jgi:hypothetical protein